MALTGFGNEEALSRNTPTFEFNQDLERIRQAARVTAISNLREWFGGRFSIEIREDVIGLGSYGKTLTVLYEIDIPDEGDEEDEDKLIENHGHRVFVVKRCA